MIGKAGFTLIEILVVLFIVSLLTGLVVANLPGFVTTADFEEETQRLKFALEQGLEKAQIDTVEVGLKVDEANYSFWIFDEATRDWNPAVDRALSAHGLAEGLLLRLTTEGEPMTLKPIAAEVDQGANSESQREPEGPKILLLSSGETTVFKLELYSEENFWMSVTSDGFGAFQVNQEPLSRED